MSKELGFSCWVLVLQFAVNQQITALTQCKLISNSYSELIKYWITDGFKIQPLN